ncbi:MAG: hypothetical protein HZB55_05920 [Deltaproteobacteria bacterium]|nr:hypothetical protein [Deltaproteobacteria bacterium]
MTEKKPYEKPALRRVDLVSEEAVLAACKTKPLQVARSGKNCFHASCKKTLGS